MKKMCFQWSIISGLNYNTIKEKELKKLLRFRRVDTDFSSYQRDWEEYEQENTSITLNILFVSHNSDEVKLVYKSIYNKRKTQVILVMINDEANNCYYFAVKKLELNSELNSLGRLQGKREAIINNNTDDNNDNNNSDFQKALDDVLNYQTIEKDPQKISKLHLMYYMYNTIQKK